MKNNNWSPKMGDFLFEEDDYAKKHEWMLKKEKINKIFLVASASSVVFSLFIGVLFLLSKISF